MLNCCTNGGNSHTTVWERRTGNPSKDNSGHTIPCVPCRQRWHWPPCAGERCRTNNFRLTVDTEVFPAVGFKDMLLRLCKEPFLCKLVTSESSLLKDAFHVGEDLWKPQEAWDKFCCFLPRCMCTHGCTLTSIFPIPVYDDALLMRPAPHTWVAGPLQPGSLPGQRCDEGLCPDAGMRGRSASSRGIINSTHD